MRHLDHVAGTPIVRVAKVYTRITRHEGQRGAMSLLVPCAVRGTDPLFGYRHWGSAKR